MMVGGSPYKWSINVLFVLVFLGGECNTSTFSDE